MTDHNADQIWMRRALELAYQAKIAQEVPVGAVLVQQGQIIGEGKNEPISRQDPCAHAEILALQAAARFQQNYRIVQSTLYVTLEPCMMCVGALVHARIQRLVFGAFDPKTGAVCSAAQLLDAPYHNHKIEWQGGVMASECGAIIKTFFQEKRLKKNSKTIHLL